MIPDSELPLSTAGIGSEHTRRNTMSLTGPSLEESMFLPTAYGDCQCECHRNPGVMHVSPCCYPRDDELIEDNSEYDYLKILGRIKMSNEKVTFETIRVPKDMKFSDLSNEVSRTYKFPGGDEIVVESPVALNVSRSGGHRVIAETGQVHYIPKGWIGLVWVPKPGANHVDF